jgi:RNA polymerase sigma-70 factor (ECF subfamily)
VNSGEAIEVSAPKPVTAANRTDPREAFQRLADEHLDVAYRLATAILRDPNEARDATHDAFVQAWRKWSTLRDESRFEPWFDRILINICRDRLRHASRWQAEDLSGEIAGTARDPFRQADDRELLGRAIAALSPDHRVVVALRYYRDLKVDDIARQLGVRAGTVQSRLHYALRALQRMLELSGGWTEPSPEEQRLEDDSLGAGCGCA